MHCPHAIAECRGRAPAKEPRVHLRITPADEFAELGIKSITLRDLYEVPLSFKSRPE